MTLKDLPIGKTATIRSVGGEGALRQHFLDMGLIPHGDVTMVKFAPMGDPMELRIHSYELTLRLADAEKIEIENVRDAVPLTPPERRAPEEIRPVSAGDSVFGRAVIAMHFFSRVQNIEMRETAMDMHLHTVETSYLKQRWIR